jgi:hypothetical protein
MLGVTGAKDLILGRSREGKIGVIFALGKPGQTR